MKKELILIPTELSLDTMDKYVTKQLKDTLNEIKTYMVEDVRTARRFISKVGIEDKIENLEFVELTKKSKPQFVKSFLESKKDQKIGVMSEAGCPGVADPGALAVSFAHDLGYRVVPLIGGSSILLALMASGLNGQGFVFHGYLPIDRKARIKKLKQLETEVNKTGFTQMFIETPFRNNHMFEDAVKELGNDLKLSICCDVTSENELIKTKKIKDWKGEKIDLHKKPVVFSIGR